MIKIHQKLPPFARKLCYNYNGFVVGGAVPYLLGETDVPPKDFDIIIHPDKFRVVMSEFLFQMYVLNSFGGFKVSDNGYNIDVWPDTLENLFLNYNTSISVVHPASGRVIRSILT